MIDADPPSVGNALSGAGGEDQVVWRMRTGHEPGSDDTARTQDVLFLIVEKDTSSDRSKDRLFRGGADKPLCDKAQR